MNQIAIGRGRSVPFCANKLSSTVMCCLSLLLGQCFSPPPFLFFCLPVAMLVWSESIAMALLIALYELCKRVQKKDMDNTGNEIIQKKKQIKMEHLKLAFSFLFKIT